MIGYSELIEWLDPAELQKMQESFSEITGMSSVTIDMDGNRLSRTTGSSDYCDLLSTSYGSFKRLCTHGRIYGAKEAASFGQGTYYYATDGLIEFSAPIIIDGEIIACLVGGMVFEYVPEEEAPLEAFEEEPEIPAESECIPELDEEIDEPTRMFRF